MRRSFPPARVATALLLAALALPAAASAQTANGTGRGVVAVPLQDTPTPDSLTERAERLWDDLLGIFGLGAHSTHFMRRHSELAQAQVQMRDDFSALMDVAGFKLKGIQSSVGLIPTLQMTFGQARELTDADRDFIERSLDRHSRRNPGPVAALQRGIVHAILEASELNGFSVDSVAVQLLPVPSVKFSLAAGEGPRGADTDRILRAIEALNRRLQQMPIRPDGIEMLPSGPSAAIRPASAGLSH